MNPFAGKYNSIYEVAALSGRTREVADLQERIRRRQDVLLLGPEGVGKSSMLLCALSKEFCEEMAATHHLLITAPFEYPTRLAEERVFPFLVDNIISAVRRVLDPDVGSRLADKILMEAERHLEPTGMFKHVIDMLYDEEGYCCVLVIDNFERFTSSEDVTMAQHEIMRSLMQEGHLRFVVATNYDLSQDSLPPQIKGSFYLQKFYGCELPLGGLSKADTRNFLVSLGGERFDVLSEQLFGISGGIPRLLLTSASEAYNLLEETGASELTLAQWGRVRQNTLEHLTTLMSHWCQALTETRMQVLQKVAKGARSVAEAGAAEVLSRDRGLLRKTRRGDYEIVAGLLADYLQKTPTVETSPEPWRWIWQ